jgi:cellobiose-specific phosphotransferase system component IIC
MNNVLNVLITPFAFICGILIGVLMGVICILYFPFWVVIELWGKNDDKEEIQEDC